MNKNKKRQEILNSVRDPLYASAEEQKKFENFKNRNKGMIEFWKQKERDKRNQNIKHSIPTIMFVLIIIASLTCAILAMAGII